MVFELTQANNFIAASNGVVLASEKKQKSVLYDEHSVHKVELITKNAGMVYSGMGPDYRLVAPICFENQIGLMLALS